MHIELLGVASKQTRGMSTRAVFQLSAEPPARWIDTFTYSAGIQVTNYPRESFHFEKDTVSCAFMGPRLSEAYETLRLYIADANKKFMEAQDKSKPRKAQREIEDQKRRQTEMLSRELFGDDDDGGDSDEESPSR